jgi:hypothetical protein
LKRKRERRKEGKEGLGSEPNYVGVVRLLDVAV